jgi:hypothetical protein
VIGRLRRAAGHDISQSSLAYRRSVSLGRR